MTSSANPLDVIETGYRLDLDRREWLHGIARCLQPLLDGGFGLVAYEFDVTIPFTTWFDQAVLVDADPEEIGFARRMFTARAQHVGRLHTDSENLTSGVEAQQTMGLCDGEILVPCDPFAERRGVVDVRALFTVEPTGRGLGFCASHRSFTRPSRRARRLWARVAAHLAAAQRIRRTLEVEDEPESVLSPSGKLEHATGRARSSTARETLREAVLRRERALGRDRHDDPERSTEAWTALVSGRWSLVDRFESDGRRYVVARPNAHDLPDPRALTERERAVAHLAALGKPSKLIAYELGLSVSTVASHLSSAMRKLGARSRVELVALLAKS